MPNKQPESRKAQMNCECVSLDETFCFPFMPLPASAEIVQGPRLPPQHHPGNLERGQIKRRPGAPGEEGGCLEGGYRVGGGWPGRSLVLPRRRGLTPWPPCQLSQMQGSSASRGKSVKGTKLGKQVGLTTPRDCFPPPLPDPSEAGRLDSEGCCP